MTIDATRAATLSPPIMSGADRRPGCAARWEHGYVRARFRDLRDAFKRAGGHTDGRIPDGGSRPNLPAELAEVPVDDLEPRAVAGAGGEGGSGAAVGALVPAFPERVHGGLSLVAALLRWTVDNA